MTENIDVKQSKKKEAINAMAKAKDNMQIVLDRNSQLEYRLANTKNFLDVLKGYIGSHARMYGENMTVHEKISADIKEIENTLKD